MSHPVELDGSGVQKSHRVELDGSGVGKDIEVPMRAQRRKERAIFMCAVDFERHPFEVDVSPTKTAKTAQLFL